MKKSHTLKKFGDGMRLMARPAMFFYALVWLMILLVAGTVAEKYIGLYAAQKLFFSSFVVWLGGVIPAPGGYSTLALIFFNLLSKLIVERWTRQKIGTLITHCGALLLLLGGFLTAAYSWEGSMVIEPGRTTNFIEDYHRNELAVTDVATGKDIVFGQKRLKDGQILADPTLPFVITVERSCGRCLLTPRKARIDDGSMHGMLAAVDMQDAPLSPDDGKNVPGIVFHISGPAEDINGDYGIYEDMPITQHLGVGDKDYAISLRRARTYLPFEVKLIKFEKQDYPGTDKPRSYSSEVVLKDGPLQWRSVISMNEPLRYKGYTFYQSSFIAKGDDAATVLAVVKNIGAIFPYISSLILCAGLLVHLFMRIPKLKMKAKGKNV